LLGKHWLALEWLKASHLEMAKAWDTKRE
jgi:hypothetical protein